jgi:hypothetical protein
MAISDYTSFLKDDTVVEQLNTCPKIDKSGEVIKHDTSDSNGKKWLKGVFVLSSSNKECNSCFVVSCDETK